MEFGYKTLQFLEECGHGSITGVIQTLFGQPVDTLKTRRQVVNERYMVTIRAMIKNEGYLSFFKGMTSPLCVVPIYKSVLFGVYSTVNKYFDARPEWNDYHMTKTCISSLIGGFFSGFFYGPTDLFKTKMQMQKDAKTKYYNGNYDCFKKIYKQSGFRAIFQGTGIAVPLSMISYSTGFMVYEAVRIFHGDGDRENISMLQNFNAGGWSGMACWFVIYPLDTVKTHRMAQVLTAPPKLFDNFYHIRQMKNIMMQSGGVSKIFQGCGIMVARSYISYGFAFTAWNYLQNLPRIFK